MMFMWHSIGCCTTPIWPLSLPLFLWSSCAFQLVRFSGLVTPSWWCILGEVHVHLVACHDFADCPCHLTAHVHLALPPTPQEENQLVPAVTDHCHHGVPSIQEDWSHQSTFIDDNAQAALRADIISSIHASEQAAYTLLGHPSDNQRTLCLSEEKWHDIAHYHMEFLGFEICMCMMSVQWPIAKCLALKAMIEERSG
jgi:hypothetical protein